MEKAIQMKMDSEGFCYPLIEGSLCINCNKCRTLCPLNEKSNINFSLPIEAYAAISTDSLVIKNSASGGAGAALARCVINQGGIVFGCAWNEDLVAEHRYIINQNDLVLIQGSKYVQSNQNQCYLQAERFLKEGRMVLYSGTPCQIAGLKAYLIQEYQNLYLVDLICHGVPSSEFHSAYVRHLERKLGGQVVGLNYREKSRGWSSRLRVDYLKQDTIYHKFYENNESYYYLMFSRSFVCRSSCYACRFAQEKRVGDITLGDYWGDLEKYHPEIPLYDGVSAVLVNSEKGMTLLKSVEDLRLFSTKLEWVKAGNGQLNEPVKYCKELSEETLRLWESGGAEALEARFKPNYLTRLMNCIARYLPFKVKRRIIMLLRKFKKVSLLHSDGD
jgi:coenzyme F420-reducing hydrogenase beta subunit